MCGYEQKITRIYDYGYTYDKRGNLVKEEEICSPTTTGPKNITVATYLYDETNRMVRGTNKTGEVSAYTFNGLGVRVGTELILEDNSHGYTDFHCQTPSVETGIEKPEVVKTDYVIDYTRLDIDQRVLMKSEQDGYDFFYTYGLDKLQVMTIGEGSNWWGQSIKKCVNMAYVHTDRLGSVVNLSDQYGRVTARADYTDWGEVRKYTDITVDGGFRRLLPEITYATHEYVDVLNQFYAKARMYDAENKRFDAVDPVKGFIADPTTLVQYLYVEDNAVNQVDPTGRIPLMAVGALAGGIINAAVTAYQSKKETGHISISKTVVSFVEGAITGATLGSNLGAVAVGVISGVTAAAASGARDKIDNSNGGKISKWQMATNAIVSGVVSGVTAGLIGGPGAKAPITRTGIKMVNQQFGMGTVKSFITQPTQRVISKNFAMGVVKTAIIAPINAAISSNVIKKFSEVSAVNLTDAKKASVTNSNATRFQNVSNISAKPGGAMKSYAPPMKRPRKTLQSRVFSGVKCSRSTPVFPHIAALLLPPCSTGAGRGAVPLPPVREKGPAAHRARPGFRDTLHGQRPFQHGIKGQHRRTEIAAICPCPAFPQHIALFILFPQKTLCKSNLSTCRKVRLHDTIA